MINTFIKGMELSHASKVNATIFSFRRVFFLKKIIPYSMYGNKGFQGIFALFALFSSIFKFLLNHALYLGLFIIAPVVLIPDLVDKGFYENALPAAVHIFVCLSIFGAFINTNIFADDSEDKYYAVSLMGLDAKEYILSTHIFYTLTRAVFFSFVTLIVALITGASLLYVPFVFIYFTAIKTISAFIQLWYVRCNICDKAGLVLKAKLCAGILSLVLAYLPLVFLIYANLPILLIILTIAVFVALYCAKRLIAENSYKKLYKMEHFGIISARKNAVAKKNTINTSLVSSHISDDTLESSERSGFAYFHELFVLRHKKLLYKRSFRECLIILGIDLIILMVLLGLIITKVDIANKLAVEHAIIFLPLVIYFLNTGDALTSAMFANCDCAMFSYNFYKTKEVILGLFKQRLKTTLFLNLLPSLCIVLGLCILNIFIGTDRSLINFVLIIVSVISMSVFFSVHRLVLYYLLQPYSEGMEIKSVSYKTISGLTYFVCYLLSTQGENMGVNPVIMAIATTVFAVVYIFVSLILVSVKSPKTFRLHS